MTAGIRSGATALMLSCLVLAGCRAGEESVVAPPALPVYGFEKIASFPHDPRAFTQGLEFYDGLLYESTGLRGQTSLRQVDLESGRVRRRVNLPMPYFGEGIAVIEDRIYMLTWQEQTGFVFDRHTFEVLDRFTYEGEGWGLVYDGTYLIMSDGTANLRYLDPETFAVVQTQEITAKGEPVLRINELEWVRGELWANIFETTRLARIDPASGTVIAWVELAGLLEPSYIRGRVDVLNGIAYDEVNDRLFVTGKWWPRLFEIRLVPPAPRR